MRCVCAKAHLFYQIEFSIGFFFDFVVFKCDTRVESIDTIGLGMPLLLLVFSNSCNLSFFEKSLLSLFEEPQANFICDQFLYQIFLTQAQSMLAVHVAAAAVAAMTINKSQLWH